MSSLSRIVPLNARGHLLNSRHLLGLSLDVPLYLMAQRQLRLASPYTSQNAAALAAAKRMAEVIAAREAWMRVLIPKPGLQAPAFRPLQAAAPVFGSKEMENTRPVTENK